MRLPDEAWIRTSPQIRDQIRQDAAWSVSTELLAQLLEEVSILAAEHRRKKPREVPRPDHVRHGAARPVPGRDEHGRPVDQQSVAPAIAALKASRRSVHVG